MNNKIMTIYNEVEEKFLVFSFGFSVIIIFVQVIMRTIFNSSLSWSEELARYLFIWQSWLGVSYCQRFSQHITIDLLKSVSNGKYKQVLEIVALLISIIAAIALAYYGMQISYSVYNLASKTTALRIPMYLIYLSMPIGCTMYVIRAVLLLYSGLRGNGFEVEEGRVDL